MLKILWVIKTIFILAIAIVTIGAADLQIWERLNFLMIEWCCVAN